jgi:hypothetical protein
MVMILYAADHQKNMRRSVVTKTKLFIAEKEKIIEWVGYEERGVGFFGVK